MMFPNCQILKKTFQALCSAWPIAIRGFQGDHTRKQTDGFVRGRKPT